MLAGLQAILDKDAILSTVNAEDLRREPQRVEGEYQRHVATFVPMGDVAAYGARLVKRVISGKTPKGMIVAPYGYGKTSTLAFLWHECESQNLIAVPPVYCATLLDILKATYGWVKFRLEGREPALVDDLIQIYNKYTSATIEEMAKRYADEHGIAHVIAVKMLDDMLENGSLILELTPSNLLFFLDAAVGLATRAGYAGLVVFADEFQQYFSRGANLRRTVQEFREFVWGLDTRANALSVIFSVPTFAEAVIQEQGKDILQRLKDDNLYYRLQDIYTADFPAELWSRYTSAFQLGAEGNAVIDQYALRAIGQIAERDDLGEGPRTVIDSFKRAIERYEDHGKLYAPIDLIDDFLMSNIRFQAQANKIKTVTRQALESTVVDTPEKVHAVKLMAAFPRGCPVEVQRYYGLHDAVVALSKQSHGEMMVRLAEGDTLLGLSRGSGPVHTVDRIITDFWQGYEEDELHIEAGIRALNQRLLPRFFTARKSGVAIGWAVPKFEPSARGGYVCLIEGTFNLRYPKRLLGMQVAYQETQLRPMAANTDIQFDFLFDLRGPDAPGHVEIVAERVARFHFNLQQKVGAALPDDIRRLQDFVLPEFVTPLLMLSLVDYFEQWEQIDEQTIPEGDKAELEHYANRLIGHAVQMLFNRALADSVSPPLRKIGGAMMEELCNRMCTELYPNYHTLFVQSMYEAVLNEYVNAMHGMTLKERRGHTSVQGTKEVIAKRFGVGSVATFENRTQNEFANLIKVMEWKGRGDQGIAEVILQLHPLETVILDSLRNSKDQMPFEGRSVPVLSANTAADRARQMGYRDEETLWALKLLTARGYTRIDTANKLVYFAQLGTDPGEIRERLQRLMANVESIPSELIPAQKIETLKSTLAHANQILERAQPDEEELDELDKTRLNDVSQQLNDLLSERRGELRGQLSAMNLELERSLVGLRHGEILDREIQGQVAFVMHLNELRQRLSTGRRQLADKYDALKDSIADASSLSGGGPVAEALPLFQAAAKCEEQKAQLEREKRLFENQLALLEKWIKLLKDTDQLFNALAHLPDLREQLTQQVVPEIQSHLTRRRLEGLNDWEPYSLKVKALEEELEKRRRHGNEQFGQDKETYERFLLDLAVSEYRPRSRYTYGEDQDSYRDLYDEVRTKIAGRLDEISADLQKEQTDLLKAKFIYNTGDNQKLILELEGRLRSTELQMPQLRRALTAKLIQQRGDELTKFGQSVKEIAQAVESIRGQLAPITHSDHQLTPAETKVMDIFAARTNVDLTDLFVDMRHAGQSVELGDLLYTLEQLYRKNRIVVTIRRRT